MTLHCLLLQLAEISGGERRSLGNRSARGNSDRGDYHPKCLAGWIGQAVTDRRRQIGEIVWDHRMGFPAVIHHAVPFPDEIKLFLARVLDRLARAVRVQRQHSKAGYGLRQAGLDVSLTKNRSVVTGAAADVDTIFTQSRKVTVQPGGIDLLVLSQQARGQRQKYHDESLHCCDSQPDLQLSV